MPIKANALNDLAVPFEGTDAVIRRKLSLPNVERSFLIRRALSAGFTIEEVFHLTKIDRWFLVQIKEIVDFEEELAGAKN